MEQVVNCRIMDDVAPFRDGGYVGSYGYIKQWETLNRFREGY